MATREHLIKDFKKEHAKKYAKSNTRLALYAESIEEGALALLGSSKTWSNIQILNTRLTSSQVTELESLSICELEIDSAVMSAKDLVKFLKSKEKAVIVPRVTVNYRNYGTVFGSLDGLLEIVETAFRDRAFFDDNYLTLLKAIDDRTITLPYTLPDTTNVVCARMLTELISDDDKREIALKDKNPYIFPALDDSPNSAVFVATIMEIMASYVLRSMIDSDGSRDSFSLDQEVIRFALIMFENTPAKVVAEGLSLMLVNTVLKRIAGNSAFTARPNAHCTLNITFPDTGEMAFDLLKKYKSNYEEHDIPYDEFFNAVNKFGQTMTDRCVEVAKTFRSLFPSKNLVFDVTNNLIWRWNRSEPVTVPYSDTPIQPSNTVCYYIRKMFEKAHKPRSNKRTTVSHMADTKETIALDLSLDVSTNFNYIAMDSKYCGLFDSIEYGLGSGYQPVRTVVADETFKNSNEFNKAVIPSTVHLGTFVDTMLKEHTHAGSSGFEFSLMCPRILKMYGVDTNGLASSKTALKAVIADAMLGFNYISNYTRLGEYKYNAKVPEFEEEFSKFITNPFYPDSKIVELAYSAYSFTTRLIHLTLADNLTIEYDDIYPIFELLDEVTKIVKRLLILSANGGTYINMRKSPDKLFRLFPRMLNPSNSMSNHAFGNYNDTVTQTAIGHVLKLYAILVSNFRLTIDIPTTCKLNSRLIMEIRKRARISNDYIQDPRLVHVKDVIDLGMFRVDIQSHKQRAHGVNFNDRLDCRRSAAFHHQNVIVGFDESKRPVTRGFEYCEKFMDPEKAGDLISNVSFKSFKTFKRLKHGFELTKEESNLLREYPSIPVDRGAGFRTLCISGASRSEIFGIFEKFKEEIKLAEITKSLEISPLILEDIKKEVFEMHKDKSKLLESHS